MFSNPSGLSSTSAHCNRHAAPAASFNHAVRRTGLRLSMICVRRLSSVIQNRKRLFLCLAIPLCGGLAYMVTRFFYLLDRPTLGVMRESSSLTESKAEGFYVGTYIPTTRQITLRDSSVAEIPNAWVEHAWAPELNLFLQDTKHVVGGFHFNIPIREPVARKPFWPFAFALSIAENDLRFSRYPGIGYEAPLGFTVYLDTLPETLTFSVEEKKHEEDSWTDAIPTGTIQFKRAF
jgi:hypothetical protein